MKNVELGLGAKRNRVSSMGPPPDISGRIAAIAGDNPTDGSCGLTRSIHSGSVRAYDELVVRGVGNIIMSTENKATHHAHARLAKTRADLERLRDSKQPVIETIDIASLQVDESYGEDCDPYNSTGQFLADALKKKYDD